MKTDFPSKSDPGAISAREAIPPLMKRIGIFLQQQNWKSAADYCERVLDLDPGISQVYIWKVLAERHLSDESELGGIDALMLDPDFRLALRFADAGEKERLGRILKTIAENISVGRGNLEETEAILTACRENPNEPEFAVTYDLLRGKIRDYVSREDHPDPEMGAKFAALFPDDPDFQKPGILLDLITRLQSSEECRAEEAFHRSLSEKSGDPFELKMAEECRKLGVQLKTREIYRHAELLMKKKSYLAAAAEYDRIRGYADAAEKAAFCRRTRVYNFFSLAAVILAAGVCLVYNYNALGVSLGIAACQVEKAEKLAAQGRMDDAAYWYKRAADQGNPKAMLRLVRFYLDRGGYSPAAEWAEKARRLKQELSPLDMFLLGRGTSNAEWYRRAVEKGHVGSMLALGTYYEKEKRHDEAAECLKLAAERNSAEAQLRLGDHYRSGLGVKKDLAEALKWYRFAAEKNSAGAQLRLGDHYRSGLGVKKDLAEAVKWYRLAAEKEYPEAQIRLGYCYYRGLGVKKDLTEAVKWFVRGGKTADPAVKYLLGNCFCHGLGTEKNIPEAAKWYRLAAEKGHTEAQYLLGHCYHHGLGVKMDMDEAAKWYRLAAEKGHTEAQFNLANTYSTWSFWHDSEERLKWYRLAAEKGHTEAQFQLGNCLYYGRGVKEDHAEAAKWYRLAAEKGHAYAQFHLAECCYHGTGVKKDRAEAVGWYKRAADQGHVQAKDTLRFLAKYGNDEAKRALGESGRK